MTACVACIRADDSNGYVLIVNTEEEGDGLNNKKEQSGKEEEEGRRGKKGQLVPRLVLV